MKSKTKKIAAGSAALALVAAVVVGGTLAYLTDETEQRANNFTFASDALDARLVEPNWDGVVDYEYPSDPSEPIIPIYGYGDSDPTDDDPTKDDPIYGYTGGDPNSPVYTKDDDTAEPPSKNPISGEPLGKDEAVNMIPGQSADKNPYIKNTGETAEWVAAKITFVYSAGDNIGKPLSVADMAKVTDAIDIDYNVGEANSDWTRGTEDSMNEATDVSQVFYYTKEAVAVNKQTSSIFSTVTLKSEATNEQVKALEDMGGFTIWIEGYAIQSTAYENSAAWGVSGTAVFNHTPTNENPLSPEQISDPGINRAHDTHN